MDDRAVKDLMARIQTALSCRYVVDRTSPLGPFERCASGVRFKQLTPADQRELLTDAPFWGWHDDQVTRAEQLRIIANILEGKPQEKWFEGVFDEAALSNANISDNANVKKVSMGDLRTRSREEEKREQKQSAKLKDIER